MEILNRTYERMIKKMKEDRWRRTKLYLCSVTLQIIDAYINGNILSDDLFIPMHEGNAIFFCPSSPSAIVSKVHSYEIIFTYLLNIKRSKTTVCARRGSFFPSTWQIIIFCWWYIHHKKLPFFWIASYTISQMDIEKWQFVKKLIFTLIQFEEKRRDIFFKKKEKGREVTLSKLNKILKKTKKL